METKTLVTTQALTYRLRLPPVYEGSQSKVYQATDPALNRMVAIKEVPLRGLSPQQKRALRSEVNSYCQCGTWCEHVPQIYHQFEQNDTLYLVMQWVPGRTLRAVLDEGGLSFDNKLELALQLCRILEPMHQDKRQHRDLRPENLQVAQRRGRRQLWLLDFNIAAQVPRLNRGTPGYLAPELTGASVKAGSGRVDVFAIGVILYEMFTGVLPLYGQDYYAAAPDAAEWADFTAPSVYNKQLPKALEEIIVKCMQLDQEKRYENAGQIAGALARLRRPRQGGAPYDQKGR